MNQDELLRIANDGETMLQNVPADLLAELVWMVGVALQVWAFVEAEQPTREVSEMVALARGVYDEGREWLGEFYAPVVVETPAGEQSSNG